MAKYWGDELISFGLIGAGGYVAPRHMRAIKAVGGRLEAAIDPSDSVGIIDSYFPDAHFFTEFEQFDRHVDLLRRTGKGIDYISICSPNYLHDAHCRFALRSNADVICEKPLVLQPSDLDSLRQVEQTTGRRIATILQLRLHPAIQKLKQQIEKSDQERFNVDLTYITSRGRWYEQSWKGNEDKAGGVATNIGIHLFDMLIYVFGSPKISFAHYRDRNRAAGFLICGRASIRWFLSINSQDLPPEVATKKSAFRSITVDGMEAEFSEGFVDLHTDSYREVLAGRAFGLDDVKPSIETVSAFRSALIEPAKGEVHPFVFSKCAA